MPAAFDRIASMFGPAGLAAVVGGTVAGGAAAQSDAPLQAGDAVGVSLMQGDLSMAGTGTVTLVDEGPGARVRAPLLQPGVVTLPDDPRLGAPRCCPAS